MSFWWVLTIILASALIAFIVWGIKDDWDHVVAVIGTLLLSIAVVLIMCISIAQPIVLKNEMLRQEKERNQIIYQIDHLTETSDKIKLNEWILTYNDWVNDVNTSKEVYGWVSWYYFVDMSDHKIIDLV